MKRIAWLSIAVILIAGNVTYADDTSFTNLQQAVDFLATALESTNFVKISSTCLDSQRKPNDAILISLQSLDQKRPLRELYADISFPTNAPTFKLGGHMKELGCTHIDFIQTNGVWKLQAMWICR